MPFDGAVARCVAEEMRTALVGGRVDKVLQPERDEIHIVVRNRGKNHKVLISANPTCSRVCLTNFSKENPASAPLFCMILRKHIGGARVADVRADGFERVVSFVFETTTEMGDPARKTLHAEAMGKRGNIALVGESGVVIDALTHVDETMSAIRQVMPARPYAPPPATGKLVPGVDSAAAIAERVARRAEAGGSGSGSGSGFGGGSASGGGGPATALWRAIVDAVIGLSPTLARECCARAGLDANAPPPPPSREDPAFAALEFALKNLCDELAGNRFAPCVVVDERDAPVDFSCVPIGSPSARRPFDSMSLAIEAHFDARGREASLKQRRSGLSKLVSNNVARCRRKLAILQESLRDTANRDELRLKGELITANIHQIGPGSSSWRLLNYYDNEYVDVELDPVASPQANAQRYYKKYKKAESAWKNADIWSREAQRELNYLESVAQSLDMCESARDIDDIADELISGGYMRVGAKRSTKKRAGAGSGFGSGAGFGSAKKRAGAGFGSGAKSGSGSGALAPRRFESSDGFTILAGRNNRQNDHMTTRASAPADVWFHAKDLPGSHVIVKAPASSAASSSASASSRVSASASAPAAASDSFGLPERTLAEAAALAAYYSKARLGGAVAVDYTQIRNVKKPSGSRPGMVVYVNYKTVMANADDAPRANAGADVKAGANAKG